MSRLRTGRADRLLALAAVSALLGACSTNDRPLPAEAPLDRPTTPVALAPLDDPKLGPLGGPSRSMLTACAAQLGAPLTPPDESRARRDGPAPLSRSILVTPPLGAQVPAAVFNQWTLSVTGSPPFIGTGIRMYEGGAPTAADQLFTRQVNNRNVVLVDVDTPTPNDYASHLWTETGGYVALPRLAGATFNSAQGLNDLGTVVGYASLPPNTASTTNATAWRYTPAGGIESLGWPVGANGSWAFSVNESGVIAGYARVNGVLQLARWTPGSGWTVLGAAQAGRRTFGLDINDNGVITGYVVSTTGERAFVWTPGTGFTVLGQPDGATRTLGIAIDNTGGVAGYSIRADGSAFGWYWKNGTFTPTGTLGESTFVTDVSNDGIVTGYSFLPGAGDYHAFAYRSQTDELIDLGKHVQSCSSVGFAVNDVLRVAGMNFIDPTPNAGLRWLALWDLTPNDGPLGGQLPPVEEVEGDPVTFTATGLTDPNGDPLTYTWTFGDGSPTVTTTEPTVGYAYKDNGQYEVSVVATDGRGGSRTLTTTATIRNVPPVPAITPLVADLSCTGDAQVQVVFTDKGVIDMPWSWTVDWGDGTQTTGTASTQAELLPLTHTYGGTGSFTVTYTVTDKDGGTASTTTTVRRTCNNGPSQPTLEPVTQVEGTPVTITATGAVDPDGDPLTYTWTFGDGSPTVTTSTPSVTHTYKDNGTYPVSVVVTDPQGGTASTSSTATIANVAPVPTITVVTPTVLCTATGSIQIRFTDAGVLDAPWSYSVNWGDGTSATGTSTTQGTSLTLTKQYAANGTFTISYTVTDKDGASGTATGTITRTCSTGPTTPTLAPVHGREGSPVTFTASGATSPDGRPLTYTWNFGDGSPTVTTTTPTVTYTYKDNRVYNVTVRVSDGTNPPVSASSTATIVNVVPVPTITASAATVYCNQLGQVTVRFTDAGVLDATWRYTVNWGDGTSTSGTATTQNVPLTLTKGYTKSGTFTVTYTVTDKDGGRASTTTRITMNCRFARCTLTQGYWKNHLTVWPAPLSPHMPFMKGNGAFPGTTWVRLFNTPVSGNAYVAVAHQWMAATLNRANGAPAPSSVVTELERARQWLYNNVGAQGQIPHISRAPTDWVTLFDRYNNGRLGVPHCDDEDEDGPCTNRLHNHSPSPTDLATLTLTP